MSDQFIEILRKGIYVSNVMNISYVVCFSFILYKAFKRKLKKASIYISVIITFILSQGLFEAWWYLLSKSVTNSEDSKWIAYHDGGGLSILFIYNSFKAFLCLALSLFIANIITKRSRLELPIETDDVVPDKLPKSLTKERPSLKIELTAETSKDRTVIIEPWGMQYSLEPNASLTLELLPDSDDEPNFEIERNGSETVIYVNTPCRYKLYLDGVLEHECPISFPQMPISTKEFVETFFGGAGKPTSNNP